MYTLLCSRCQRYCDVPSHERMPCQGNLILSWRVAFWKLPGSLLDGTLASNAFLTCQVTGASEGCSISGALGTVGTNGQYGPPGGSSNWSPDVTLTFTGIPAADQLCGPGSHVRAHQHHLQNGSYSGLLDQGLFGDTKSSILVRRGTVCGGTVCRTPGRSQCRRRGRVSALNLVLQPRSALPWKALPKASWVW